MKKLFLIAAILQLFISVNIYAQKIVFKTQINDSASDSYSTYSAIQAKDGGYVTMGTVQGTYTREYIERINRKGKLLWYKEYNDSIFISDEPYTIREALGGGFVISGSTSKSGHFYAILEKIDTSGNVIWLKTYGDTINDRLSSSLELTKDSGYIIAGYGQKAISQDQQFMYIVKTNKNGDTAWTAHFGDSVHVAEAKSIKQTSDSGFIVAGKKFTDNNDFDFYLVKMDKNGKKVWDKLYGSVNPDVANSVVQTRDGGYMFAGSRSSDTISWYTHMYVMKLDANGDSVWGRKYGNDSAEAFSLIQARDGEYVTAGDLHIAGKDKANIMKISSSGIIRWQTNLSDVIKGEATSVMQTADSGYVLAGFETMPGPGKSQHFGAFVIKTDTSGRVVDSVPTDISGATVLHGNITLYPNPFSNQTTLYISGIEVKNAYLSVYDINGQEVKNITDIHSNEIIIQRDNLQKGIYFYCLINNGQLVSNGKMMVE